MANGIINLVIKSASTGQGFDETIRKVGELTGGMQDASKAAKILGGVAGQAGQAFGGILGAMLGGGLWTVGAKILEQVVGLMKKHNELMKDGRLAAKGLSREYMTLEAAARGYQRRVDEWRKAKAEADKAEADAIRARKREAEEAIRRQVAHLDVEKKWLSLTMKIEQEKRKVALLDADEVEQAKERARIMKEEADLAVRIAKRDVEQAQLQNQDTSVATAALELAKQQVATAAAAAEKIVEEAQKKMVDEADAAEREILEQRKQAEEEAEKKRREEQKKTHQERIEQIRGELAAQLDKFDKEIAKAKEEADVLERNAQRARGGKTFGEWERGERQLANEQRRADVRQANVIRNAEKEVEQLESERRRFGRAFNPRRAERLARLREFIADQDPNNNPALKKAQKLEEDRKRAEEQAQKDIAAIKKAIEQGIGL